MVSRWKPGTRVGALSHSKGDTVYSFGYGTYVGDEVPISSVGVLSQGLIEHKVPNPKIELDNGKVVWGCECWWGGESAIRKRVAAFKNVVELDIDQERAKTKGGSAEDE